MHEWGFLFEHCHNLENIAAPHHICFVMQQNQSKCCYQITSIFDLFDKQSIPKHLRALDIDKPSTHSLNKTSQQFPKYQLLFGYGQVSVWNMSDFPSSNIEHEIHVISVNVIIFKIY